MREFTYFSRASLDYIAKSGKQPDVLHVHNWETAIVGPLFWDIFVKQPEGFSGLMEELKGLGGTRVLLTCHDFDSQCLEQPDKLALCGLDPASLHRPDRLQDHTMTHLVNVLKYQSLPLFGVFISKPAIVVSETSYPSVVLDSWTKTDSVICIIYLLGLEMRGVPRGGLVYSNKVVIVSSMYSKERIISSFSHRLEPTLDIHKDKLLVSPCGFDNFTWDPSKDKFLPKNYSADDLKGKSICKVALQQQLGRGTLEEEIDAFQKFTAPIGAAPIALVKIDRGLLGMARLGSNRLVDPPG
ncbi:hypothetical protein OIU78_015045 [Salix suchowensis]|nr:hypothetical protein OIU78_015045 [Salix suchowensis]